jgi:hypothetical protein
LQVVKRPAWRALLDANAHDTRTLAVRFSEPSGLLAYSAAPARNAAISMMKPVDNHTTSMGMMEIMGSRAGRFTRNDSVQPISVASTRNGSFLLESSEQNFAQGMAPREGAPWTRSGNDGACCRRAGLPAVEQGRRRPTTQQLAWRCRPLPVTAEHEPPRCRMRRPPGRVLSPCCFSRGVGSLG